MRILLVEDNPIDARLIREMLRTGNGQHFEVEWVDRLSAALERCRQNAPDAILLDLNFPDARGIERLSVLRESAPDLPIVVLTSLDDEATGAATVRAGAQDYLVKGQIGGSLLARAVRSAVERRRAEAEIRQSEQRFRLLAEHAQDIIFRYRLVPSPALEYVSPAVTTVMGYTPEDCYGDPAFWRKWTDPADPTLLGADWGTPFVHPIAVRVRRKDGTAIWLEVSSTGVYDPSGNLVALEGIARDVTARKEAEEEARSTGETLKAIIEASPLAICVLDADGRTRSWNSAAERIFGWTEAEAIGGLYPFVPEGKGDECRVLRERAVRGEVITDLDTVRLRRDGARVDVSLSMAPLRDAVGRVSGIIAIIADTTERRRGEETRLQQQEKLQAAYEELEVTLEELRMAEDELRQAKEDAEAANRAKSEFLSRMSHELRTPLNSVLGFAQLLDMDQLSAEQRESVDQILRGGRHLLDLINEVLDIARIESGRLVLSSEAIRLDEVVLEAVELIRPLAIQRSIEIDRDFRPVCGSAVEVDRQRLLQVLLNLLSNAVKYNRPGGQVIVSCRPAPEGRLRLAIHDTGPGIPEDKRGRLFSPFQRLGAEQSEVEGTGLGLALSKRLVEAMGGTIGVESTVGQGSTFWIDLRVAEEVIETPGEHREPVHAQVEPASDRLDRVLYVEDNPSNLNLVERILERRPSIRLLTALQGRMALDLARQHRPELILLDLHLPDIPGETVLSELRADPRTRDIPIVVISADATDRQIERLRAAGVREYLTKPFDVRRLLEVVDEVIGAQQPG